MSRLNPVAPHPHLLRRETADAVIFEPEPPPGPAARISGPELLQRLSSERPTKDYVIPGLRSGTVGLLYGSGGSGKSWLAFELACAIAGGPDLTQTFAINSTGQVTYLTGEDDLLEFEDRLAIVGSYLSPDQRAAIAERLLIDIYVPGPPPDLLLDMTVLEAAASGSRLVVIDTLRRFHIQDENDSREMMIVLQNFETTAARTGAAILLVHHINKSALLNGTTSAAAAKGSAVLTDHPRWAASLSSMSIADAGRLGVKDDQRSWHVQFVITKCTSGPLPAPRWLKRGEGGILLPCEISERPASSERRGARRRNDDEE